MEKELGLLHIETRNPLTKQEFSSYYKNHLRSLYGAVDVDTFFALVNSALEDYYATWRVKTEERFIFTPLYPKNLKSELLGKSFNYITYKLVSRRPGVQRVGATRHKPPFRFDAGVDVNYAGYRVESTVQFADNLVQFDIQTTSYTLAEEYTRWFEGVFMPTYEGTFQAYGINQIHFEERLADMVDVVYENTVYIRPLRYSVGTQVISSKSLKTLDSLSHQYEL